MMLSPFLPALVFLTLSLAACAPHQTSQDRAGSPGAEGAPGLNGTSWRLEDLAGAGVIDNVEATLEFPESGQSITFGPLGSTRMACPEAVMNQETTYLKALEGAERFTREGSTLLIYSNGLDAPLRFLAREP